MTQSSKKSRLERLISQIDVALKSDPLGAAVQWIMHERCYRIVT